MSAVQYTRVPHSPVALGIVSEFVSRFPPFNDYEFGLMIKTLLYQLEQGNHLIAGVDDRIVAYVGWIATTRAIAEDWLENDGPLSAATENVDTAVLTVVVAENSAHLLPLIKRLIRDFKKDTGFTAVYWKQHLRDGRVAAKRRIHRKT